MFVVSNQLFIDHENWHEGYLSERRTRLVSNSCLAMTALNLGLDAFILTSSLAGRGWKIPLISEAQTSQGRRTVSSKVLADVVEALVGAAFVDGGFSAARACIHKFLPDIRMRFSALDFDGFDGRSHGGNVSNPAINKLESLFDHQFRNKTVLLGSSDPSVL